MIKRWLTICLVLGVLLLAFPVASVAGNPTGWSILLKGKDLNQARAAFRAELDENPHDAFAALGLAYTLKIMGYREQSVVTALKGLKNSPGSPSAFLLEDFIDEDGNFDIETTRLIREVLPTVAESPEMSSFLRFQVRWSLLNQAIRAGNLVDRRKAFDASGFIHGAYFSEAMPWLSRLDFLKKVPARKELKKLRWAYYGVNNSLTAPPDYLPWPDGASNYYVLVPFSVKQDTEAIIYLNGIYSFKAQLDEKSLVVKNNFEYQENPTTYKKVLLKRGTHRLLIKINAPDQDSGLHIALLDSSGNPLDYSWADKDRPTWGRVSGFRDRGTAVEYPLKSSNLEGSMLKGMKGLWLSWLGDSAAGRVLMDEAAEIDKDGIFWNYVTAEKYLSHAGDLPGKIAESRAERNVDRLTAIIPDAPMVRFFTAVLKQNNSDSDESIKILAELTEKYPSNPMWFVALAEAEVARGWSFEARKVLKRASSFHPQCEDVEEEWISFYSAMGDRKGELEAIRRLGKLRDVHRALQSYYEKANQWDDLLALFKEQKNVSGDRDKHYEFNIAWLELKMGQFENAANGFEALLKLDPKSARLSSYLAVALFMQGRNSEALKVLDNLKKKDPSAFGVDLARVKLGGQLPFQERHLTLDQVLKEDTSEGPEQAPSSLILDHMTSRIQRDGSSIERYHGIIKVNNKDGVNREGELYIPGQVVLSARTIKPDGTIYEPEISEEKHTGSLKGLEAGDLIEYEYLTLRNSTRVKKNGYITSSVFLFQDINRPFHRTEMYVEYPVGFPMRFKESNLPSPGKHGISGKYEWRDWNYRNMPRLPMEPATPDKLVFTPHVEAVGGVTWTDLSLFLRDGLIGAFQVTPEVKKAYSEATEGATTKREKLSAIIEYCMKNVEGERASNWSDPTTTLLTSSGSRMPLAAAFMKLADIKFDILLAQPVNEKYEEDELPRFAKFREPVLSVDLKDTGDTSYFTLENPYKIPGIIDWNLLGARALPLTSAEPWKEILISSSKQPWKETKEVETRRILPNGDAEITYMTQLDPYNSMGMRTGIRRLPKDQYDKVFQQILSRRYGNIDLKECTFDNLDKLHEPLLWRYSLLVHGYAVVKGHTITVSDPLPALNLGKVLGSLDVRTLPITDGMPFFINQEITFEFPDGYKTSYGESGLKTETPYGSYSLSVDNEGQKLVFKRLLDMPYKIVKPEQYLEFKGFLSDVDGAEDAQLKLDWISN